MQHTSEPNSWDIEHVRSVAEYIPLEDYKVFYNQFRCHTGLTGVTPAQRSGAPPSG